MIDSVMHLALIGHDYKYAVEQTLLTLFPDLRPQYGDLPKLPDVSTVSAARINLSHGALYSSATTILCYKGTRYRRTKRVKTPNPTDRLAWDRAMQKIIKLSFYHAARQALVDAGNPPPWGAFSGIRPGKVATALLEAGNTPQQIRRKLVREYDVSESRAALCINTATAGLAVKSTLRARDVCLYINIPFCPTRCAYCSFVSNAVEKSLHLIEPFLAVLTREIAAVAAIQRQLNLRIRAVYIGGGTPTTLTAARLDRMMGMIAKQFDLSAVQEYTVEAGRVDTIDCAKLEIMRKYGVTRVCINPQSFEPHVQTAIGRRHTAAEIANAVLLARAAGISQINMDLIAGLPTDTAAGFARSLARALSLEVDNITIHTLSLKRGSRINEHTKNKAAIPPQLPVTETVSQMLDTAQEKLTDAGFMPYYLYRQKFIAGGFENVGWAKPGAENFYNIAMMEELCTILALGAGGVTKLVNPDTGQIERIFNPKFPYEYIERCDKILEGKQAILEWEYYQ